MRSPSQCALLRKLSATVKLAASVAPNTHSVNERTGRERTVREQAVRLIHLVDGAW